MPFAQVAKKKSVIMALTLLLVITGVVGYFVFNKDVPEAAAWFNDDWSYRQAVPITNSGTALTDYQVSFTLNTSTLISAGKMQADCDDLRVADAQGNVLPYWIENSSCNTTITRVWTKLISLPVTTINIFVYYGNTQATSLAKGSDVFVRIDDFESYADITAVQNAGWKNYDNSTIALVADGNSKVLKATDNGGNVWEVNAYQQFDSPITLSNYILEARWKTDVSAGGPIFLWQDMSTWCGSEYNYMYVRGNNCNSAATAANVLSAGTWYNLKFEIRRSAGGMKEWYNNTLYYDVPDGTYSFGTFNGWGIVNHNGYGPGYLDFMFIRQYAATEPTIGSLGSEEKGGGPVAYWRFDEGQGNTAYDATSSANNGALTNSPTWLNDDQCISGKCLSFNGTNNYVEKTSSVNQPTGNVPASLSAWIKIPTGTISENKVVVFFGVDTAGATGYGMWISPAYKLVSAGPTSNGLVTGNTTLQPNTWYHVASVYNGSTNKVYLNGVEDGSLNYSSFNFSSGVMRVGAWGGYNSTYTWKGILDDVKIYNYARSANQIKLDYNAGKAGEGSDQGTNVSFGAKPQKWLSDGLVGYWKTDEASGDLIDSSGNLNTATVTGTTVVSAKYGNGRSFNGTSDKGDIGDKDLVTGKTLTASAWIKTSAAILEYAMIVGKNFGTWSWAIQGDTSGNKIRFFVSTNSYNDKAVSNNALNDGNWHHVVGVYDGNLGSANIKLYVDGVLQTTTANQTINVPNTTDRESIGACIGATGTSGYYFSGTIDETRLYNRSFTPQEVLDLYNWAPAPVGYWKLDDNTGTSTVDSASGNNGSLVGGSSWQVGKLGQSIKFDGSTARVTVPASTNYRFTGDFTIGFWARGTNAGRAHALSMGSSATPDNIDFDFNDGYALWVYWNGGGGNNILVGSNGGYTDGVWRYYTLRRENGVVYLYVNGLQVGSAVYAATMGTSVSTLTFGGVNGGGLYWNGNVDEVKIYNYARSVRQLQEDMGTGVGEPISYWRFEEGQGTSVKNNIVGGANGTINAATWTTGKYGKGLNFDGSTSYIDTNMTLNVGGIAATGNSYSAWVKTSGSANKSIVGHSTSQSYSEYNCGGIELDASNNPYMVVYNGSAYKYATSSVSIADSQWHHVVGVNDPKTGYLYMYVDGKLRGSMLIGAAVECGSNLTALIGKRHKDINPAYFSGQIDEVKIFNYALNANDVQRDYNGGLSSNVGVGTEAGNTGNAPVGWWKLDDNTGTTAIDSSGNSNNGTLVNSPTWSNGQMGSSILFNGLNQTVSTPTLQGVLNGKAGMSIFAWVKPSDITTNRYYEIARQQGTPDYLFAFQEYGTVLSFGLNTSVSYSELDVPITPSYFTDGKWHFVEATYDGSMKRMYIDGLLQSTTEAKTGALVFSASTNYIGSYNGVSEYFKGRIDDIKIYDYARTQAQVSYDYNRGGPVGYWTLDDAQGTTAKDFSGQGNNGNLTAGQAWTDGKYGKCPNFDGTDDYISLGTTSLVSKLQIKQISVGAWFKTTASQYASIVSEWSGGANFVLQINTDRVSTYLSTTGTAPGWQWNISQPVNDGNWHHVVMTFDGTNEIVYLDGKQIHTVAGSGNVSSDPSMYTRIGAYANASQVIQSYFNGQIDDVRIYNYALDASQVKQTMQLGVANKF